MLQATSQFQSGSSVSSQSFLQHRFWGLLRLREYQCYKWGSRKAHCIRSIILEKTKPRNDAKFLSSQRSLPEVQGWLTPMDSNEANAQMLKPLKS